MTLFQKSKMLTPSTPSPIPWVYNKNKQSIYFIVLPAKYVRHIGIMTPLASSSVSSAFTSAAASNFWFLINKFEGMHQFYSKFTEM